MLSPINLTTHTVGYLSLAVFTIAYVLVIAEEFTRLRKSKPVILASGIIWGFIAFFYAYADLDPTILKSALERSFLEFTEIMMFLLVAMTYINSMEERNIFVALRNWMIQKGFNFQSLFWLTGILTFIISPVADNLTTALLMCAVVLAMAQSNKKFINIACINIVVAANAGGSFSPFGDITTLMVWQREHVSFTEFFTLFIPALANWLIPAVIMSFFVPKSTPTKVQIDGADTMKRGAFMVILLFLMTIITAVSMYNFLNIPPVFGMLTGLAYLQFFAFYLKKTAVRAKKRMHLVLGDVSKKDETMHFDFFHAVARSEWDTLLFFYGMIMCVGGLGFLGYLTYISEAMYAGIGATYSNILIGVISAVIDNIPVMFTVLAMEPNMNVGQWLLVTLTVGVGGSLLSIGSAAGIAIMGKAKGHYTFFSHLIWTPVIILGYIVSIGLYMWLNPQYFQ